MANETVQGLSVRVQIKGKVIGPDGSSLDVLIDREYSFTDGSGNNQIEQVFLDESRPLNATNEDLDVYGTLTDFKGATLGMSKIRVAYFENLDEDSGDLLTVKQPAANGVPNLFTAASDGTKIQPGGLFLYIAPGADAPTVTAATGDLINAAKADNGTFKMLLAG